jgi:hypothetical protein
MSRGTSGSSKVASRIEVLAALGEHERKPAFCELGPHIVCDRSRARLVGGDCAEDLLDARINRQHGRIEVRAALDQHAATKPPTQARTNSTGTSGPPSVASCERCQRHPRAAPTSSARAQLRDSIAEGTASAAVVYATDKVAKVRRLRLLLNRDWSLTADRETAAKLDHYWAGLDKLERKLADRPLVRQLRFELEALAMLPPHTDAPTP